MLRLDANVLQSKAKAAGHHRHEDIAAHVGVNRSAVTRALAGGTPSLATVFRMARAYKIPMESLVITDGEPAAPAKASA